MIVSSLESWYNSITWPQAFLIVGGAFAIVSLFWVFAYFRSFNNYYEEQ